jgi:ribonuclease VapC
MEPEAPDSPSIAAQFADPGVSSSTSRVAGARGTEATVIDASAILALLFGEPGADVVADAVAAGAVVGTANLAEVATVLARRGHDPQQVLRPLCEQVTVEPFTTADALKTAELYDSTASLGLSLGDRACLALALRLGIPALTAEQAWSGFDVGIDVKIIRGHKSRDP